MTQALAPSGRGSAVDRGRRRREAALPSPRGPLSEILIEALGRGRAPVLPTPETSGVEPSGVDPFGADLQLALYVAYEMHYRGFTDAAPELEWDPSLIAFREQLDHRFMEAVAAEVGPIEDDASAVEEMDELCVEPIDGEGVSFHLRDTGTWHQFREYFAVRSLYHLKEADPHAWAIPRLRGQAKSAFVAVENDEFGGGQGVKVHQELFGDLLQAAELDADYLGFLDAAPAVALASVNLMSSLGLHRSRRGACIGHFAATEITSPPGSARLVEGLRRLGAPEECVHFYSEHVEADAVHEQILRTDVVEAMIAEEPELERDVVFGIRAFDVVEEALGAHLMDAWSERRDVIGLHGAG